MTTIYISPDKALPTRRDSDHYPTEDTLIRAALNRYLYQKRFSSILDPGAGDGRWGLVCADILHNVHLTGIESRDIPNPGFKIWHNTDFLLWPGPPEWYDFIVGNPPYGPKLYRKQDKKYLKKLPRKIAKAFFEADEVFITMAELFIRRSWELLEPGGRMIFLLRLAFQAGIGRASGLWQEIPPVEVAVCSRRPSFYGGGTNGTDYGIFVWDKDGYGKPMGKPGEWRTVLLEHDRGQT